MARPLRVEYPGACYHVMNRGRRKEKIFFSNKDFVLFLDVLRQTIELFHIEVYAYALMPNHYHLFLRTPEGNISRSMRHLDGVYTQRFNKRHKVDGSLFRGRYKSILVEEDMYMLELVRYIHRNPQKSGLEKELGTYEWCSYRGYLNNDYRKEWLKVDEVLMRFGKYEKDAKRKFKTFIEKRVPENIFRKLESSKWPVVMGGKGFKEKIIGIIKGRRIDIKETPGYRRDMLDKDKKELMKTQIFENKGDILSDKGTHKHGSEKKALIYVLRKEFGMKLKEIALYAGNVKYTTVSNQYKKAEDEIKRKEGCYKEVKKIADELKWKMKT